MPPLHGLSFSTVTPAYSTTWSSDAPERSARKPVRSYPITRTHFTWSPTQDTRAKFWKRIKAHVQNELDQIWDQYLFDGRLDRRRASLVYEPNRRLFQDYQRGSSVPDLTHRYGLRSVQVRDVVGQETGWSKLLGEETDAPNVTPLVH